MSSRTLELSETGRAALSIFAEAVKAADASSALRRAVRLHDSQLTIFDTAFNLKTTGKRVYVIAMGKAAFSMAAALSEIMGSTLTAGVVSGSLASVNAPQLLSSRWKVFEGGHPLPDEASLAAARAASNLAARAERERALLIFLISGGGSAMLEAPSDERITLEDLREANRVLVSCGATIAEINSVRRAFSAIKGGRLGALAPHAEQVSLIVSDTNPGEEAAVASGPTFDPPQNAPDTREVIAHYSLEKYLPPSVLQVINEASNVSSQLERKENYSVNLCKHYLLLDNRSAVEAAASAATSRGFAVEIARDLVEQPVDDGCNELLARLRALRRSESPYRIACLISGGEFACPVRGDGTGGRNAETVLRCAMALDSLRSQAAESGRAAAHTVVLSAGTDGIDGNSPAAGAICDETTLERARGRGLDAESFLERSDAYTFFKSLGDAVTTGPTSTNVRDVRIMISV